MFSKTFNFYDFDSILADEERIKVRFEQSVNWCGSLYNNSNNPTNSLTIDQFSLLSIQLWQLKMIKESKQLNSLVTVLPDKCCTQETIHLLLANPININLFDLSRYFFLTVISLAKITSNDKLYKILLSTFLKRSLTIYYQLKFSGNRNLVLERMDLLERRLFKQLNKN